MKILIYPDPFLNKVLPPCTKPVPERVIDSLVDVVYDNEGLGLAANQVGLPYRIIVVFKRFMVNPVILDMSEDKTTSHEGCLSLPGKQYPVQRSNTIIIRWQTTDFKETKTQKWGKDYAWVAQHEIDHLNGILINEK